MTDSTCPKCGRPEADPAHGWCACMTSWERIFAAAAYRRGLRDGVEVAQREAYIHWDDVIAAAEEKLR